MGMVLISLAILGFPFLCGLAIVLFFRRRGNVAGVLSVLVAFVVACLSVLFVVMWNGDGFLHPYMEWFSLGGLTVNMGFLIDKNAALMLLIVGVIAFLIQFFSLGYMKEDDGKGRYFAGLSIFTFSMMGIVLADNLIMLFVFWELVGFSSYALIDHYKDSPEAVAAAKKAFIVNRVGDFGFLVGIVLTYWHFGTVDLEALSLVMEINPGLISTGIAFLLMCGFLGKSAQFPLQVWLPDAMAGPTPVSALIHAATMVAAGIYLLVRIHFLLTPEILSLILWLGALMAVYAGFCAIAQEDIKKILAYSTLSQLGYMAVGVGLGYPGLALFHLTTHAVFKALLFLGSGSVIHALDHEQNIFRMGGLFRRMPITAITFGIGLLALCGVIFTSGYFSKDAIIEAAMFKDRSVFILLISSAFITALYMGRLFWVAFLGQGHSAEARQAQESHFFITFPLIILALGSIFVGYVGLWPQKLVKVFSGELDLIHEMTVNAGLSTSILIVGSLTWVLGLGISYIFYGRHTQSDYLAKVAPRIFNFLKARLWFDEIYNFYVVNIQQRVANLLSFVDVVVISGLFVRGSAGVIGILGLAGRSVHTGSLHTYVYWFLIGLIIFGSFAFGLF